MSKKVVQAPEKPASERSELEAHRNRVDNKISEPGKYEIRPDDTFKIEFYLAERDGRWVVMDGSEARRQKGVEKHWVEFRMWTFSDEIDLRKKATTFDSAKRMHLIDHDLLNRLKVQKLLKDWSFSQGNDRLRLFHSDGVLVDESYEAFSHLHPNIARHIIEAMNNVLEFNG